MFRCSHLVFFQNGVSNKFAKFTEKQLCRSLFFYLQMQALGTQALRHRYFHANFAQCLITPVAIEHLQRLLWNVHQRCQWDTKKTSLVFSKTIAQEVIFVKISWNLLWFCIPNFSEATYKALLRNFLWYWNVILTFLGEIPILTAPGRYQTARFMQINLILINLLDLYLKSCCLTK